MIKINKRRNVGILFETLTTAVLDSVADGDRKTATKIFLLIKEYFMNEGEIKKAYKIYSQLLYNESRNIYYASKFMKYLIKEHNRIDKKILKHELDLLYENLKKIADPKEILNRKIPNYKLFASYQSLLDENRFYLNAKEQVSCEGEILEHLQDNQELKRLDENEKNRVSDEEMNINKLATVVALKNFKEKYSRDLTTEQLDVMIKYFTSENDKTYARWLEKRTKSIVEVIDKKRSFINSDNVLKKIDLLKDKLNEINNLNDISSQQLTNVLLSIELKDQIAQLEKN